MGLLGGRDASGGHTRVLLVGPDPTLAHRIQTILADGDELTVIQAIADAVAILHEPERADVVIATTRATLGPEDLRALSATARRAGSSLIVVKSDASAVAGLDSNDLVCTSNAGDPELRTIVTLAGQRARLQRALTASTSEEVTRLRAERALHELTASTTELSSFEQVARTIAAGLADIVQCDLAAAVLVPTDSSGPVLHIHCRRGCPEQVLQHARDVSVELASRQIGATLDENAMTVTLAGESIHPGSEHDTHCQTSTMCVPIRSDDAMMGAIVVCSRQPGGFSPADVAALEFVSSPLANSLVRMSQRMKDTRRRLHHMVDSMADGLIMTDLHSDDVLINPAARQMLSIDDDQTVTTQFLKDKLGFYPFDLINTAGPAQDPLREDVKIGDRILHSMVSPVRDGKERLVGVVVVLRDMTEARELDRKQREFVSVVSHELRTPLTSIAGALDIVLSVYAGKLSDKQRRYLVMARESCTRLNSIVDDLLDVARSESGQMPIHFTPLALDDLAREVVNTYRSAASSKKISLSLDSDTQTVRILGDPDRLMQVLNNLVSNAIKFTPDGGDVRVEVFGPSVAADHVGVSVFNNGESIPEIDHERIFDKFEQVQESSTRRVGGTGLGLAISRAIVEGHGGRIWVETPEMGTKFVFTLPAAPEEETEREIQSPDPQATLPPATILIYNDDVHSRYILKGILMAAGHDILLADDADEALALARAHNPALVVIDVDQRNAETLALARIFKHDPETRKSSVLVVAPHVLREQALRSGADAFVTRPIAPTEFRDTCHRLIVDAGRSHAHRVLIVDDDPSIRSICRAVLESAQYEVHEATDGDSGFAQVRQLRPDLVLLDVMMPRADGFAMAKQLRKDASTSMTPLIFLSAKGETADKVRAFRLGAEDYMVKPFDAAELIARISKVLDRRDRELNASPTTQLPGGNAIETEIDRRMRDSTDAAYCYLDLDNLKAFNDYYGYAKADGVIRQTGDLIRDVVAREGNASDFIGHIAGDDFVFITSESRVDQVCTTICAAFSRLVPLYYNKADRERGYIETQDRYGVLRKFPIMSVSLAAVTSAASTIASFSELAVAAAQGKKLAKEVAGSSYVRDGKLVLGTSNFAHATASAPG